MTRLRAELDRRGVTPARASRILEEVAAHLADRRAALIEAGARDEDAEAESERLMGGVEDIAIGIASLDAGRSIMNRSRVVVFCVASVALGVVAGSWWTSHAERSRVDRATARMEGELKRLEVVRIEAIELERRVASLEDRAGLSTGTAYEPIWPEPASASLTKHELALLSLRVGFGQALEQRLPRLRRQAAAVAMLPSRAPVP